jgi:hypothetical protein
MSAGLKPLMNLCFLLIAYHSPSTQNLTYPLTKTTAAIVTATSIEETRNLAYSLQT